MMMNKILKTFFALFIIFTCQMFFCVQYATIVDASGRLTKKEISKLERELEPFAEYGNIDLIMNTGYTAVPKEEYARDYYNKRYGTDNGTVIYMDLYNNEVYIFSGGKNCEIITSDKAIYIEDKVRKDLIEGEYYKCASRAFSQIYILLSAKSNKNILLKIIAFFKFHEIFKCMCNFLFATFISFFICFLFIFSNYQTKKKTLCGGKLRYINFKNVNVYKCEPNEEKGNL